MKFKIEKYDLDMGTTPIENMFINTYLSFANGDQIKVYLYAYAHTLSNNLEELTNEKIAREMGLTEGQVVDAWQFWIEEKLVEIRDGAYVFKSIRSEYLKQILGAEDEEDHPEDPLDVFDQSLTEEEKEFSMETKQLIEDIESIISSDEIEVKLKKSEIEKILGLVNEFKVDPSYIGVAYNMTATYIGNKAVPIVTSYIRNQLINGIDNLEKLTAHFEKEDREKRSPYGKKKGKRQRPVEIEKTDEDIEAEKIIRKKFEELKKRKGNK